MSATTALLRGRAAALRLMQDACVITRLVPNVVHTDTDPETGAITPSYTTIYTGQCKVQTADRSSIARPTDVGEAQRYIARLELHLPMTVTGVASDDIATITASVLDPDLPGRVFHLRELSHKSFLTARRFSLIEVTS
jgi:hypothetical protein